jgi:hypothetical protein
MAPPRWLFRPVGETDKVVTTAEHGHVLANNGVWSPDSRWIVFDTRSDPGGDVFDSETIAVVNPHTRQVKTLFESENGAKVGMASWNPVSHKREIVVTLGPEHPTTTWTYAPHRRRGALVDVYDKIKGAAGKGNNAKASTSARGGRGNGFARSKSDTTNKSSDTKTSGNTNASICRALDARDLLPDTDENFTAGALRGGTAAHSFSPDGLIVSGAYEDAVLLRNARRGSDDAQTRVEKNYRSVSLTALDGRGGVVVDTSEHPRNHSGAGFTVVATTHEDDQRFVDQIGRKQNGHDDSNAVARAAEECWVGRRGYRRSLSSGGGWQGRAMTFLGEVDTAGGRKARKGKHLELFVLDLQVDPSALRVPQSQNAPLAGSATTRPRPPFGVSQRRVTFTDNNTFPGLTAGPKSNESSALAAAAAEQDPCIATKGNSAGKSYSGNGFGAVGPRFWPRTSPCGARAAVVAMDDDGVPQLFLVRLGVGVGVGVGTAEEGVGSGRSVRDKRPSGRNPRDKTNHQLLPLTALPRPGVQSAFSWSPDGDAIAFAHDGSVCWVRVFPTGDDLKVPTQKDVDRCSKKAKINGVTRLTKKRFGKEAPRPEAVEWSPCGRYVSYVRRVIRKGLKPPKRTGKPFEDLDDDVDGDGVDDWFNQICVIGFEFKLKQPFFGVKRVVDACVVGLLGVASAVATQKVFIVGTATLRRRALAKLTKSKAGRSLDPKPRAKPKEAWRSFATELEKTKQDVELKAQPRTRPKEAWSKFAAQAK